MEKVGIEIELMGGEEALALLKRIDNSIDTLNKRKKFKSLSGLKSAKGELESYISELQKLQKEEKKWQDLANKVGKENMSAFGVREWEKVRGEIEKTNGQISKMSSEMDEVTIKTKTFGQVFKSVATKVAHVGSAMQSLGNAMVRLTSPFRRLTSGLLMGAGYKALGLFSEGLSNVFTRSDTMKNYDRSLKALGLDTKQTFKVFEEAKTAKENLDEAVQGLPTSLDEIMAAQKVYAGATGEMVESTKTAIAANNTFLASGMGAREQRFMQRYLVAMASGAELTTMQWQSMARIAPLAMRAVSKELGYADDEYAQFTKDVQEGTVAGKDFLKAFQKVGISGAVADAARVQTESWAGLASNIRIAVTRAGQSVIDTLNETFKDATGRTLLQRLLGIDAEGQKMGDGVRDWINSVSESIQNWIKAHPDELVDFFNDLKSIDWKGLAKGLGEGALEFARLISVFANWASGKDLSKIGKWMPRLNILGNGLLVVGGFLKGTRHIWGLLGAGGMWLGKKAFGKVGIFGKIAEFFGKEKAVKEAGEIGKAVTTASPRLISAFKNIALISGIVATPAITGFVITEAIKRGISNFKETISLLKDIEWDDAKKVLAGIGGFLGGSAVIGGLVGKFGIGASVDVMFGEVLVGAITAIATGFAALDTEFIKTGVKNFSDTIKYLNTTIEEINKLPEIGGTGDITSKLERVRSAMREIADVLEGKNGSPMQRGEYSRGMPTLSNRQASGVNNIANAIKSLKDVITNINALAVMGINTNVGSKLTQIGKVIDQVYEAFPKLVRGKSGAANLNKGTNAFADALIGIRRMAYHINQLGATSVDTAGFASFVSQLKTALEELKSVQGDLTLDVTVKLAPGFERSVKSTVTKINNANRDIKNAIGKIKTEYSKDINIKLNAKVAVKGVQNAITKGASAVSNIANSIHPATGGMVYRSGGGTIPRFTRRGTDTVPAMLTPGEYVHNRRAVSTFGIDFMRKVNSLDVKGAMNELMHRAGGMANINRGRSVINNYNNNQKVVINNNGNTGAGFTFKSASRFVGAF